MKNSKTQKGRSPKTELNRASFSARCAERNGENGASAIGYTVYSNRMPASQEAAPCLARARPDETLTQSDIVEAMVKDGCHMTAEEINRVFDFAGVYLMEHMPKDGCSYDLGFVRLFPAMSGPSAALDAPFNPAVNRVYIAAVPTAALRNALSGGVPGHHDSSGEMIDIRNVTWGDQLAKNTVKSGEAFYAYGTGLHLAGEDATARLDLPDGSSVDVVLDERTVAEDGSQRLSGRLPSGVQACEGAVLVVSARWDESDVVPRDVASNALTVLAGAVPPAEPPTITLVHGEDDDDVNLGGCDVYVVGEHLDGATAVEYCETADGEAFYTMDAAYDPETGRLSGHADFVGSSPQRGFARVTTPGGTATHAVEFSNH